MIHKKIDKKVDSFLFITMKLNKSLNPNIYYCFGNKYASLSLVKRKEVYLMLGNQEISSKRFVMAEQTHSTQIRVVKDSDIGSGFLENKGPIPIVDGFITNKTNVFIVIKGADCTPILVYSKKQNVIGGCHSGRQGTKNGIIKVLLTSMTRDYGLNKEDLVVMIGPAISGANYQVSEDIYSDFVEFTGIEQDYRKIDMQKVILHDVLDLGIQAENIVIKSECTYASPDYFSYREDKTKERQISIIGIVHGKIFE